MFLSEVFQILTKPWRIQQRPCSVDMRHIGAMVWKEPLVINGTVWPHLQKVNMMVFSKDFQLFMVETSQKRVTVGRITHSFADVSSRIPLGDLFLKAWNPFRNSLS